MQVIIDHINKSLRSLKSTAAFKGWFNSSGAKVGDVVLINNSFVFRQVQTNKNEQYLGLKVAHPKIPRGPLVVLKGLSINRDIGLVRKQSLGRYQISALNIAVAGELKRLGELVFVLIGQIDNSPKCTVEVNHNSFSSIDLDPIQKKSVQIRDKRIIVNDTYDEESIWQQITALLKSKGVYNNADLELRSAVGVALDKLTEKSFVYLRLPSRKMLIQHTVIDSIVDMLRQQRREYFGALKLCEGDPAKDSQAFTNILRIAYNFACDATTFIRLIVSICDLKPPILWATIHEHFRLSEAFKELPWQRLRHKPSLQNYRSTIADARNSAFHKLFPFRKTMEVKLPTSSLRDIRLRIFSKYKGKLNNDLVYHDKELVDVLMEFTRAGERQVAPRFWRQNLNIMDAAIALFSQTGEVLKNIRALV